LASDEEKKVKETIRRIALLNALRYRGRAESKPVLGKLFQEQRHLRIRLDEITSLVAEIVRQVNELAMEEQRRELEEKWPEAIVEKETREEERKLPPLPNVEKYERVVTRFSPNPDCVLHLGSARAIVLSYEYAKTHNGSFYLRFEDTDPKLKKPQLPFYDAIREDLLWLGCRWDMEFTQSDRLSIYYEHIEKLLRDGNAYVCTCRQEEFRQKVLEKQPCPCRNLPPDEQILRWRRMLNGTYSEGEAVARMKTDLSHPNPAVRDWPALRIIDTERYPHPRVGSKHRVWPLYNFACGVDDHTMCVTHIIRGKEHLTNQVRQEYMYRYFGWEYPEAIHYGRLKVTGALLSKSKILQGFRSGVFWGWDDPRLATFAALRRRGITPEAIKRLMIDVGPKTADVVLSWENLYAHNRKVVDTVANRYFFVHDPVKMTVESISGTLTAQISLHPDHPERGSRQFKIEPKNGKVSLWVSRDDVDVLKRGRIIRLMELFNVKIEDVEKGLIEAVFHSETHEEAKMMKAPLIHWIPHDTGIPCKVAMPDASISEGIAEDSCRKLHRGEIVQFERFGFAQINDAGEKIVAYFAHR